eukprot:9014110-Pyramimonas_sp.AAC.2
MGPLISTVHNVTVHCPQLSDSSNATRHNHNNFQVSENTREQYTKSGKCWTRTLCHIILGTSMELSQYAVSH